MVKKKSPIQLDRLFCHFIPSCTALLVVPLMASYEQSPSIPVTACSDLSRSLDDAFLFTSSSGSPHPNHHSMAASLALLPESPSSSDTTFRGGLITEHRQSTPVKAAPTTPSKAASNSLQVLEAFLEDDAPVTITNIPVRHSPSSLLKTKPKTASSAPPSPASAQLSQLPDGKFVYPLSPSDSVEGLSLRFGVKVRHLLFMHPMAIGPIQRRN